MCKNALFPTLKLGALGYREVCSRFEEEQVPISSDNLSLHPLSPSPGNTSRGPAVWTRVDTRAQEWTPPSFDHWELY